MGLLLSYSTKYIINHNISVDSGWTSIKVDLIKLIFSCKIIIN